MRLASGFLLALLAAVLLVGLWADRRFQRATDDAVRALLSAAPAPGHAVTDADLAPLPPPVRRWLEASGVVGRPIPSSVRLRQRGLLRTAPDQAWMPARAEQYFRTDEPGFVWRVRVRMFGVLPVAGRDAYRDGKGRMLIAAASLVPVVDAADEKIDHGTLLRYLGEMVWFPAAALRPYVRWEPIDDRSARAAMRYGGVEGSAVFTFDDEGRFVALDAERYLGGGAEAKRERWAVQATAWETRDGVLVPVRGDALWHLRDGDFSYYRWEITTLEYDRPALFGAR